MKIPFLAALFAGLTLFGVAGARLCGQIVLSNDSVLLLTEDFTGGLGSGTGQVRWEGSGGFAAVGGDRVVQIGGSPSEIIWGAPNFIGNGRTLILGDPNADGTLIWDKALNLGGSDRSIRVLHGSGNTGRADARLDKALRGASLTIEGDGRLDMTVGNPQLARMVSIYGAELRLNAKGRLDVLREIRVSWGGLLTLDNAGTSNSATGGQYEVNRLLDSAFLRFEAGNFRYIGQTGAGGSVETFARMDFYRGSHTIDIINNRTGFFSEVRVNLFRVLHQGAAINFISSSGVSDFGDGARLSVETGLSLVGGIVPYATVNGADWASANSASPNGGRIVSYSGYNTGAETSWNSAATNASPMSNQVLSGLRIVNSLRLTEGRQIDLAGRSLAIAAGALLSSGAANTTISGGSLDFLGRWAYVHVYNTGGAGLTISSRIIGRGLTKTGPGQLTLSGRSHNAVSGAIYVNEGQLIFQKSPGRAATQPDSAGRIEIGDRGHSATVRLDNSEQIGNQMNVWLRGGFADPARHVGQGVEGILQFNGAGGAGITETFRNLDVEGRGVIDFQGGTLANANFLILEDLSVRYGIDGGSVLLVRNWVDFEDRLLVRRSSTRLIASLPYIHFEGYAPGAVTRDYNAQYWEVVPAPEPSTYGAILGAAGLALWRRRRRKSPKRHL